MKKKKNFWLCSVWEKQHLIKANWTFFFFFWMFSRLHTQDKLNSDNFRSFRLNLTSFWVCTPAASETLIKLLILHFTALKSGLAGWFLLQFVSCSLSAVVSNELALESANLLSTSTHTANECTQNIFNYNTHTHTHIYASCVIRFDPEELFHQLFL